MPDLNSKPVYVLLCFLKGSVIIRSFNITDADEMAVFTYEVNSVIHLGSPHMEPATSIRAESSGCKCPTSKTGHCGFQNQPIGSETGQYPPDGGVLIPSHLS